MSAVGWILYYGLLGLIVGLILVLIIQPSVGIAGFIGGCSAYSGARFGIVKGEQRIKND